MNQTVYTNFSDEELIVLLCNGTLAAFDELYLRYAKSLKHYFFRMLDKDNDLANDYLQELMIKLCNNCKKYNGSVSFKTWLFSIAHNQCKNFYRHKAVVNKHHNDMMNTQNFETNTINYGNYDKGVLQRALHQALDQLSYEKREIVLLRFQEEKSITEIAIITGVPEGTVKSRLHYALGHLAQLLQHHRTEIL